ncbi:MAG TPA: class I SAM-dependent methyltransferase [Syntrophorhabdaceae bacterium]|nr:class I SAM-dependent methyltransferase [Syntrophorhabdaceae bacterium]
MELKKDDINTRRKDFFNEHAEKWQDMFYKDKTTGRYDKHKRDFDRLFSLIPIKEGDTVLDVGCGTGILVPFILNYIKEKGVLYELDYAKRMLQINKKMHKDDNIIFILADAEDAPFAYGSCDLIICFSCFPHLHDKRKATKILADILKDDGFFIISHFDSSDGINRHHSTCNAVMHDRLPDKEEMFNIFHESGIEILNFIDEQGFYFIMGKK